MVKCTPIMRILTLVSMLFALNSLHGQDNTKLTTGTSAATPPPPAEQPVFCKNEISLWAAGGLSTLYYKPTFGDWSPKFGGNFGVGYTRYFTPHVGLLIGAEYALYNARVRIENLKDTQYGIKDKDGDIIDYSVNFTNYVEKQRLSNINIPLMLQFQTGGTHKFFVGAGFKLGIPVSTKYESTDNDFTASGYYHYVNQWDDGQIDLNFGHFTGAKVKGTFDVDLSYTGSLELGMKWALNPKLSLYTGVYADYTFNNINKVNTNSFLDYSATQAEMDRFAINSVVTSQYTTNGVTKSFVDKMQPVAIGLKLRLGINTCGSQNVKDSDEDGIPDNKDKCPGTPKGVPVDEKGCPKDSDGDGVPDYLDKCPNTKAGAPVDSVGCPKDSDGDGVPDYADECPNTPAEARGYVDEKGCPKDSDGDGVPDYKDKCPNTPAGSPVDEFGCSADSDGDGVPDYLDKCPGTPAEARGYVDEHGCPKDSDGDGVPDYLDRCPGTKAGAPVDIYGCPKDSDGDGVPDYADECPGTPKEAHGYVDERGCPKDTDGDGVFDYMDKCPKTPGPASNYGCPELKEEEKRVFERALRGIHFETGKDIIRPISFPILNEVVKIMAENPHYLLEIHGHTDNVGKPDMNQDLSERRAASVKRYLVNQGISSNRLSTAGFGDTRPVVPNTTIENKALNRRVEFIVKFEE